MYLDQVDFMEALVVSRLLNIQNADDILVVEVAKQLHFTQRAETEHAVVERRNLLDGDFLTGWLVYSRAEGKRLASAGDVKDAEDKSDSPDDAICALANHVLNVILFRYVERNFATTARRLLA